MSVKVTSNGRSTLPQLHEKFEKVYLKYDKTEDGTAKVTAALVHDGIVHIGVSKFSNRTYNFSKTKGRAMALGRAELAANIFYGVETVRQSKEKRREELSFSIKATDQSSVDDIVTSFLGFKPKTTVNS
jgi:hypothetical protein